MSALLKFETEMALVDCANCGIEFCIPNSLEKRLRTSHGSFYCPRGHSLLYGGKSEAEKVRERLEAELATERRSKKWAEAEAKTARKQEAAAKAQLTRLKKRVGAGVCTCCNRTFQDLARHMATKHKEQVRA